MPLRLPGGGADRRRARGLPRLRPDGRGDPRRHARRSTCCSAAASALLWLSLFTIVGRASRRLRHQAMHDTLTGLPNRTSLYERIGRVDRRACATSAGSPALLLIDLDRFKEVNDTLGHDHGDRCCARSPSGCARRCAAATRWRGSAATSSPCCCSDLPDRAAAAELAARLLDALERPFVVARRDRPARGQRRRRAAARPRHRRQHARPARRRRDVRGQARAGPRPRLRRRARPELPRAAAAR